MSRKMPRLAPTTVTLLVQIVVAVIAAVFGVDNHMGPGPM